MKEIWEEIKESYREGSYLTRVIYFIVLFFFFIRLSHVLPAIGINTTMDMWVSVPSDIYKLLLRPWTPITYMFSHYEVPHLFFNLIGLYAFGRLFISKFSERQFLALYFLGGIVGAIFFILGFNYIPLYYKNVGISYMLGASASIMALLYAVAAYSPKDKIFVLFFGEVKIIYVAILYILLDISSLAAMEGNSGGHLAHIGGGLTGLWFALQLKRGDDITRWMSNILDKTFAALKRKPKIRAVKNSGRPLTDMEWNARRVAEQAEVDRILDKVRASGYESLTNEEKQKLFEASKKF